MISDDDFGCENGFAAAFVIRDIGARRTRSLSVRLDASPRRKFSHQFYSVARTSAQRRLHGVLRCSRQRHCQLFHLLMIVVTVKVEEIRGF